MDYNKIIKEENFNFQKKYGQNFITDTNLLQAIVQDCNITKEDNILEIGPGAGTLTSFIAQKAGKVLCFEIDENLKPILEKTLEPYNNVQVVFKDIMQSNEDEILKELGQTYSIIANLPYYITTPIIFKFLESNHIKKMCIMVQKEVAERIVAKSGKDYGILSILIDYNYNAKIARIVNRQMFNPTPNVDSAIVILEKVEKNRFCDYKDFVKVVHACFSMRRKTLINNLSSYFAINKNEIEILLNGKFDKNIRAENLSTEDFEKLTQVLQPILK